MKTYHTITEQEYAEFAIDNIDAVSGSKVQRIRRYAGKSILDVGCGPGAYLQALKTLDYQVAGVDSNRMFIYQASQFTDQIFLLDLEVEALSMFDDESFDTVLILDVLEHIENDEDVLRDAMRVCRQNVIISVPAPTPDSLNNSPFVFRSYVDPTHLRYYSQSDLANLFLKAEVNSYEMEPVLRFDPILYQVLPWYFRCPLAFINKIILKFSDSTLFAAVWFGVGWKKPT